jgi:predicted heme/steroid binding protein/uncharacterized membrane protein
MEEMDRAHLSKCNGRDGNPIYIAHEGKIYDVSASKLWAGGLHMKRHVAGKDQTTDIQAAPHGPEVLDRYPQLGVLMEEVGVERSMPRWLSSLLAHFPLLRRHPHPMVVHFPIVFMFSAVLFTLFYLVTGIKAFETTGLHCLAGGILFLPVAFLTGWFTWWFNYLSRSMRAVTIKIRFTLLLMAASVAALLWRISVPDILHPIGSAGAIYLLILLSLIPLVTVVGWFGATLTFPLEKE